MVSQLGWIDFSSEDRDKVKQALALAAELGTLDELGIGQIRDSYADLLFPGVSTLQTRAKYFITVPRLLRDFQECSITEKKHCKGLQGFLQEYENRLVEIFLKNDPHENGIIGGSSINKGGVKRLPSEIYWNGLRTFGLIQTRKSLGELIRSIGSYDDTFTWNHEEDIDDDTSERLCVLPEYDSNWMSEDQLTIHLSQTEAEFLKDRMTRTPGLEASVISQLFDADLTENFLENSANSDLFAFDTLAELMLKHSEVDEKCKKNLRLARDFSLAMEGPHIVLNILLARKGGASDEIDKLRELYAEWRNMAQERKIFNKANVTDWLNIDVGGRKRNVKVHTSQFISEIAEKFRESPKNLKSMKVIVSRQSEQNKKALSLLKRNDPYDRWVGMKRLDYRLGTARNIIQDIVGGLSAST